MVSSTITLLTDFGLTDEYVGVMKGVILSYCPGAVIVDINHNLPRHDIMAGARMLAASYPYFPKATIHLVVVDPGVGTDRRILVIKVADQCFIGPDNGVLSCLLTLPGAMCFMLKVPPSSSTSATFHGRDLMAPVAGKLGGDQNLITELCVPVSCHDCHQVRLYTNTVMDDCIIGEVVSIDHFGNIATSISQEEACKLGRSLQFSLAGTTIRNLKDTYSDVEQGQLVAIIDSSGYVEISANCQDASKLLEIQIGDTITVKNIINA